MAEDAVLFVSWEELEDAVLLISLSHPPLFYLPPPPGFIPPSPP